MALPDEIRQNLSQQELAAYERYDQLLSKYMMQTGVPLANDQQPPKEVLVEVEALEDCGEVMTEQGPVVLNKHSRHLMRRNECELLIRQGLVQQIDNNT
jgi:GINS complex subunit 1